MNLIQALRQVFPINPRRTRRVRDAAQYLMDHVGLRGRCDCLSMRDGQGRPAYLLVIYTRLSVPVAEREQFQPYFQRKLAEWGEIGRVPLMVVIRDAHDMARAQQQHRHVSSSRIASVLAAANVGPDSDLLTEQLAVMRQQVRDRAADRRRQRAESAPMPLTPLVPERPVSGLGDMASI
ncbi:hypothetical protein [Ottowia sp.]|uniref:hypothetical protein n=1 Tax=Ottowia sp. TaxID=1898956 RepID=UPI003A8A7E10